MNYEYDEITTKLFDRATAEYMLRLCGEDDDCRHEYRNLYRHDLSLIRDLDLEKDFYGYANDKLEIYMGFYGQYCIENDQGSDEAKELEELLRQLLGNKFLDLNREWGG